MFRFLGLVLPVYTCLMSYVLGQASGNAVLAEFDAIRLGAWMASLGRQLSAVLGFFSLSVSLVFPCTPVYSLCPHAFPYIPIHSHTFPYIPIRSHTFPVVPHVPFPFRLSHTYMLSFDRQTSHHPSTIRRFRRLQTLVVLQICP